MKKKQLNSSHSIAFTMSLCIFVLVTLVAFTVPLGYSDQLKYSHLHILIPALCVITGYILWFVKGKNAKAHAVISFYPPRNLNSAEIGAIYKGYANSKDIASLLIYLAHKGYWDIEELDNTAGKKSIVIVFKKHFYDGSSGIEGIFFDGLYNISLTDEATGIKYVTEDILNLEFHVTSKKLISLLNENLDETLFGKRKLSSPIFPLLVTINVLFVSCYSSSTIGGGLFIGAILALFFSALISDSENTSNFDPDDPGSFIGRIIGIIFIFLVWVAVIALPTYANGYFSLVLSTGTSIIILIIFAFLMPKRTPEYLNLYGEILGFKQFLDSAQKERLDELVADDPRYFYDILPFTYVLEVSNKWIDKYKSISYVKYNFDNIHADATQLRNLLDKHLNDTKEL
ncbi:MAG: DUF2207 domain-containing protein [Lachnospira sp.]|nr:DUF2207 domain-containing protein [Lachnospira sp.]